MITEMTMKCICLKPVYSLDFVRPGGYDGILNLLVSVLAETLYSRILEKSRYSPFFSVQLFW